MATVSARIPITLARREIPPPILYPFTDYFKGFEKVGAVRAVFGDETERVLGNLKLAFLSNRRMYMGIRDDDGNIAVGAYHLAHSDKRTLYLDVVHELFHIKQFMDDKKWFRKEHERFMDERSLYYASPIEVPAYYHTVKEARRIGMAEKDIVEYLKMAPSPPKVFSNFLKAMEIGKSKAGRKISPRRYGVRIIRKAPIELYPFSDYFKGFEKASAIRALFGNSTEQMLDHLRLEFVDFPFPSILPSDYGDNHLIVSRDYLRKGSVISLYLDVFLCLNILKRSQRRAPNSGDEFGSDPAIVESYRAMIEEARKLGLSKSEILNHTIFPRFFMSPKAYSRFLREIGIAGRKTKKNN